MFVCVNAFYLQKSSENCMFPGLNLRCGSYNGIIMADIASLLRSDDSFLAIKIHVVIWMDWLSCLRRFSSRGAVNRSILVSILEQQYPWWRFYPAFSNTLGFYSACLPFRFF